MNWCKHLGVSLAEEALSWAYVYVLSSEEVKETVMEKMANFPSSEIGNDVHLPTPNTGIVSRAVLGRRLKDWAEHIWTFVSATMPWQAETGTETLRCRGEAEQVFHTQGEVESVNHVREEAESVYRSSENADSVCHSQGNVESVSTYRVRQEVLSTYWVRQRVLPVTKWNESVFHIHGETESVYNIQDVAVKYFPHNLRQILFSTTGFGRERDTGGSFPHSIPPTVQNYCRHIFVHRIGPATACISEPRLNVTCTFLLLFVTVFLIIWLCHLSEKLSAQ